jgi:hypothetical protein
VIIFVHPFHKGKQKHSQSSISILKLITQFTIIQINPHINSQTNPHPLLIHTQIDQLITIIPIQISSHNHVTIENYSLINKQFYYNLDKVQKNATMLYDSHVHIYTLLHYNSKLYKNVDIDRYLVRLSLATFAL